ncbi:acyl-CoA thioesterase [Constantimarinum furrinae]|uniref:Acyl-CoA thioester hydrolase n=1 Tax=Constantimarinum furrinae TaxID=2562285 RepID=A0A7G8PTW7_9FLAO|nr:acyl-CoA thioesterase [Constantimarinum furrinae]QNJ97783.1 Acyl-CoA thioester hydrolase [Constantimarinum furrinae]
MSKSTSHNSKLKNTHEIRVRFNETDPLGIVWHGYYIQYFEEGREAFGREHGISYLDIKAEGYVCPIVRTTMEHKLPLRYGDVATIETVFIPSEAAKMIFRYNIFNENKELVCHGETIQVFTTSGNMELALLNPAFYKRWKHKMGL